MSPTMTAAELRVTREWMGVSARWLAGYLGVQERTVQRWEAGGDGPGRAVPEAVATAVWRLVSATHDAITQTRRDIAYGGTVYVLRRGTTTWRGIEFPASWHRRVVGAAGADGMPSAPIEYDD